MKSLIKPNLKYYCIISIFLLSFIVIPSNSTLYEEKTNGFSKFSLSSTNPEIKIFSSSNKFFYELTLNLNITNLVNDNLSVDRFIGGDIIDRRIIDTPVNLTMRSLTPFLTIRLFNTSSNGVAEGFYKLTIGKRTLNPGIEFPLIVFIYEIALFTMQDIGIPESIGRVIFIFLVIALAAIFIYLLYKLKQKIRIKIKNNIQLNYYNWIYFTILFFTIIIICYLMFIPTYGMYF